MQSKSVRRPSPALIVAILALVAALTGSAIALPGKNTVKSNDIAKNAVGSSDIKNNKVKGSDVDESSFGKVPSAAKADSAAAVDTQRFVGPVRLNQGQEQALDTKGPFTITARCIDETGDDISADLVITTSQDNTSLVTDVTEYDPDFDTGEEGVVSTVYSNGPTDPQFYGFYNGWNAISNDGNTRYVGERSDSGVRVGGGECYFALYPVF